jgi:hypothetical protein
MEQDFQHVIVTRFNLALVLSGKAPTKIHDKDWLEFRFQIFRTSCYPSMVNQTNQNFTWFVLFDPGTPDWVWDLMATEFPRATVIKPVGWHHDERLQIINEYCKPSKMLLSSRLDSDDCLHKDFVAEAQKAAIFYGKGFLNFTNGYTMSGGRFYRISYPCNAFQCLYEPRENANTSFYVQHQRAHEVEVVHEIKMKPLWLQVIHGSNVGNDLYGVRNFRVDYPAFGIIPDSSWVKPSLVSQAKEITIAGLRNFSRRTGLGWKIKRLLGRA